MSLPWLWSVALLLWSKLWVLAWLSQDRQSCHVHLMVGTLQLKILKSRVDFSHHVLVPVHPCLVAIEVAELRMVLACLVRVDWPRHGGHLDHGWDLLLGTLVEYALVFFRPTNVLIDGDLEPHLCAPVLLHLNVLWSGFGHDLFEDDDDFHIPHIWPSLRCVLVVGFLQQSPIMTHGLGDCLISLSHKRVECSLHVVDGGPCLVEGGQLLDCL